jgi:methionyl-tRNA formyltransferase
MSLRVAHFGLPLAAVLLHQDGHDVCLSVLPPLEAPGARRLRRTSPATRVLRAEPGLGGARTRAFDERVTRELGELRPELIVSWFWTRRIPAEWLELAPLGGIGAHPSLLPRHRGPNPYYAAIDAGDDETGVTIHTLTPEYDDGDLLLARALVIGERDSWQLARALDRPSLALLREAVAAFARGAPPEARPQPASGVTWAPEPEGDALRVTWTWTSGRILRRIRALAPVPGLALDLEGLEMFVTRASPAKSFPSALEPGEAALVGEPPVLVLRTGDGAITVERAILPAGSDGPDAVLERDQLGRNVQKHLAGRNAARVG